MQAVALDLGGLTFAAELDVALLANRLGGFTRRLEPFAGIKFFRVLSQKLAHRTGHGQADVGVDVDLAHAELDGFLNLFDRHAVGFFHVAAVLANDGQQLLRHARRAMHHQVGVGNTTVDFHDALNRQDVTGGLARELVSAVAGANGNGQRVQLGALDEVGRLLGVGQQLFARHHGIGAVAVFLVALHGLERAKAAQLAFHRDTELVRHVHHLASDFDVVVVAGDGLAIGFQTAVHHDGAETQVHRALADAGVLAVVLVHDQRNVRVGFDCGLDQMLDERLAGIFACACTGLQNDRCAGFIGGFHDGLNLLEVVDVESRNAVGVLGGVVEQFAHGNESHEVIPWGVVKRGRNRAVTLLILPAVVRVQGGKRGWIPAFAGMTGT